MTHKHHAGSFERQIAQHMIRMNVRIDHIAHGQSSHVANGTIKRMSLGDATAGIDYGDAAITDHKSDIRNFVVLEYHRRMSRAYINA